MAEALQSIVEYARRKRRFVAQKICRQKDFNAVIVNHINGSKSLSRVGKSPDPLESGMDTAKSSTCPAPNSQQFHGIALHGLTAPAPTRSPSSSPSPATIKNRVGPHTAPDALLDDFLQESCETDAQPEEEPVPTEQTPQQTLRPVLSEGVLPPDLYRAISAALLPNDSEGSPAPPPEEPQIPPPPPSEKPILLLNSSAAMVQDVQDGIASGTENNGEAEETLTMIPSKVNFEPADVQMPRKSFQGSRTTLRTSSSKSLSTSQRLFRDVANWPSRKSSKQYTTRTLAPATPIHSLASTQTLYSPQAAKTGSNAAMQEAEENILTYVRPGESMAPDWGFASSLTGRRCTRPRPHHKHQFLDDVPVSSIKSQPPQKHQPQWFEQRDEEEEAHKASTSPVQQQSFQDDEHFLQQEQMLLFLHQQERQLAIMRSWEQQQVLRQQQQQQPMEDMPQVAQRRPKKSPMQKNRNHRVKYYNAQSLHGDPKDHNDASAWWADQKPNLLRNNTGNWRAPRLWAVGK